MVGLGNAHALFDRVTIDRVDPGEPVRNFSDYRVRFDGVPVDEVLSPGGETDLGNGVTLMRRF